MNNYDERKLIRAIERVGEAHDQHCQVAHPDENMDPTCPECKRLVQTFLDELGITPETIYEVTDKFPMPEFLNVGRDVFQQMFPRVSAWD